MADSRITLHEPVLLKLTVENTGAVAATLDLGWNSRQGLLVTVIKPDGTVVKAPAFRPLGGRIGHNYQFPDHAGDR